MDNQMGVTNVIAELLNFYNARKMVEITMLSGERHHGLITMCTLSNVQMVTDAGIEAYNLTDIGGVCEFSTENAQAQPTKAVSFYESLMNEMAESDFSLRNLELKYPDYRLYEREQKRLLKMRKEAVPIKDWTEDDVNLLSKAVIISPQDVYLWQYLTLWMIKREEDGERLGRILEFMMQTYPSMSEPLLTALVKENKKSESVTIMLRQMQSGGRTENISGQKSLKAMLEKEWFTDDTLRVYTEQIHAALLSSMKMDEACEYQWNCLDVAWRFSMQTGGAAEFYERYKEYLNNGFGKIISLNVSYLILSDDREAAERVGEALKADLSDNPYREFVLDMLERYKEGRLGETEKEALRIFCLDKGNALSISILFGYYSDMCFEGKEKLGMEVMELLRAYNPADPILVEVEFSFMGIPVTNEELKKYYELQLNYLRNNGRTNENAKFIAGRLLFGNILLENLGMEVESLETLIAEHFPQAKKKCEAYRQVYTELVGAVSGFEEYADLPNLILRSVFSGDWSYIIHYRPDDDFINRTVLAIINQRDLINVPDDYYRSVVRSIARVILTTDFDMQSGVSRRMQTLFRAINAHLRFRFNQFCGALLKAKENGYTEELLSIWSFEIELSTLFRHHFGNYVLRHENCAKYADVFSIFIDSGLDIFSQDVIGSMLFEMEEGRAKEIAVSYERLYNRPVNGKRGDITYGPNIERNVFASYLRKTMGEAYLSADNQYARFRDKLLMVREIYGVPEDFSLTNWKSYMLNKPEKCIHYFASRAFYYYFALLSGQKSELSEDYGKSPAEFINAVTLALTNNDYAELLTENCFTKEERNAINIIVLLENGSYGEAYSHIESDTEGAWRGCLAAKFLSVTEFVKETAPLRKNCMGIVQEIPGIMSAFYVNALNKCDFTRLPETLFIEQVERRQPYRKQNAKPFKAEEKPAAVAPTPVEGPKEAHKKFQVTAEDLSMCQSIVNRFLNENRDKEWALPHIEKLKTLDEQKQSEEYYWYTRKIGIEWISNHRIMKKSHILLADIVSLVKPYADKNRETSKLYTLFLGYLLSFDTLDELIDDYDTHKEAFAHLRYEQNAQADIKHYKTMKVVLDALDSLLSEYDTEDVVLRQELKKAQNNFSRVNGGQFSTAMTHMTSNLIQKKINELTSHPILEIYTGSDADHIVAQGWYYDTARGYIRGVVENHGTSSAYDCVLHSTIRDVEQVPQKIDKIFAHEVIAFNIPVDRRLLKGQENTVSLSFWLEYSENSRGHRHTGETVNITLDVDIDDDDWDLRLNKQFFDLSRPAVGESFIGRASYMKQLTEDYTNTNILVTGLRRAGKSSVIRQFISTLPSRNVIPVYVDGQAMGDTVSKVFFTMPFEYLDNNAGRHGITLPEGYPEFRDKWALKVDEKDWISLLPSFFTEFYTVFGQKRIVFVLDELEKVFYTEGKLSDSERENLFGVLRSMTQGYVHDYCSFIFCGADLIMRKCEEKTRDTQFFQTLRMIKVSRMSRSEIGEMFRRYNEISPIPFRNDAVDRILQYTNGQIWYTKILATFVIERVLDAEKIEKAGVQVYDVDITMNRLVSGELNVSYVSSITSHLSAVQRAILTAMADLSGERNSGVSSQQILEELLDSRKCYYCDKAEDDEKIRNLQFNDIVSNLNILCAMELVQRTDNDEYEFVTDIYRLAMMHVQYLNVRRFLTEKEK